MMRMTAARPADDAAAGEILELEAQHLDSVCLRLSAAEVCHDGAADG